MRVRMALVIDIPVELRPCINGAVIETAPSVAELYAVLGDPSRVVDTGPPAPAGHRNNRRHVYDELGAHFLEHHHTRRMMEGTVVLWPEEESAEFRPRVAFCGTLSLAGYVVPPGVELMDFLKACPIRFRPLVGGLLGARRGGFHLGVHSIGRKLASRRRSKVRRLVDLSFSWPHDDWGEPAGR